jgi:hypothetical protein
MGFLFRSLDSPGTLRRLLEEAGKFYHFDDLRLRDWLAGPQPVKIPLKHNAPAPSIIGQVSVLKTPLYLLTFQVAGRADTIRKRYPRRNPREAGDAH